MAIGRAQQKRVQAGQVDAQPEVLPFPSKQKVTEIADECSDKMRGLSTRTYYDATGIARKK